MKKIIVSLTSYPAHINSVHLVIESLLNQTLKANKIILWLTPELFPNKEKDLPKQLLALKPRGLTIDWYKDLRSYTKLIPTLHKYPDDIIITVDDDVIYKPKMIEKLYRSYRKHPNDIHAHRISKFTYKNEQFNAVAGARDYYRKPSFLNKLTGVGGVLYPPHCFYRDIFNEDLFMNLAPTNDDQWFWLMAVLNGVRVRVVRHPERKLNYVPNSQETGLYLQNDGEDHLFWIQFQNMLDYYPDLTPKLLSEVQRNFCLFRKERLSDGVRNIYFMGMKIFSYKKHRSKQNTQTTAFADILRCCAPERLPELLKYKFFERTGKLPTEKLSTLSDKIIWASMFDVTPLKVRCADKLMVRDYVRDTIGNKYLPKLYDVYKTGDDFDFNKLPDKFVLSLNCGSGQNLVVTNKYDNTAAKYKNIIRQWLTYNHSQLYGEMQYYYMSPCVIARELIDIRTDIEYKVWCFGGRATFICVISYIKGHESIGQIIYNPNWNKMSFYQSENNGWQIPNDIPKPKFLDEMIKCAESLAAPFDFVRVDFYETKSGKIMFGELTFSPTAGLMTWSPNHIGTNLKYGAMFKLPPRDENGFAIR